MRLGYRKCFHTLYDEKKKKKEKNIYIYEDRSLKNIFFFKKQNNFFSETLNFLELVYRKRYWLKYSKYFFEAIQNSGKSNRMLRAWTEVCHQFLRKLCEIYIRMCDVYRKACFCRKVFKNRLNKGSAIPSLSHKVHEIEKHWLSGKEKVLGTVEKKVMSSVTWKDLSLLISLKKV